MNVYLNGEGRDLPEGTTVGALLSTLELGERRVAVEVNEEVVPSSRHADIRLSEGDRVEIVHAIGGG